MLYSRSYTFFCSASRVLIEYIHPWLVSFSYLHKSDLEVSGGPTLPFLCSLFGTPPIIQTWDLLDSASKIPVFSVLFSIFLSFCFTFWDILSTFNPIEFLFLCILMFESFCCSCSLNICFLQHVVHISWMQCLISLRVLMVSIFWSFLLPVVSHLSVLVFWSLYLIFSTSHHWATFPPQP